MLWTFPRLKRLTRSSLHLMRKHHSIGRRRRMARTWERWTLLIWVWGVLCGSCRGRFVVEKCSLKVVTPESLKGSHESSMGNFGVPLYGGSMRGNVTYLKENGDACKSFEDFNASFKSAPGQLPTILLVDRGVCYFTLKAWHAQNWGAAAILVADDKRDEDLITMDTPRDSDLLLNITIPAAFIKESLGNDIKNALSDNRRVTINLDWTEALPHPDERVEYEFWTNSNDECGPKCDTQIEFVKNFKGAAQILERDGYAQFTPHYITWFCPPQFLSSEQCRSQCINNGRYCAPDPEQDFTEGYNGRNVVIQNLRELCFFKVAQESNKPWLWWDFVSDFAIRCPMKKRNFTKECAEKVIQSLRVDLEKINQCIGDPDADMDNPVLKAEQDAQIGNGSRGDVSILPTLIINNRQYRGKLDRGAVLKAVCAGFQETTEPAICLSSDIETNECLENNGGCWQDKVANVTACRDTFRGRVCECPFVRGVKFVGDGYTHCKASGALRCEFNNGGCWNETRGSRTFSACVDDSSTGCTCPPGFTGDGVNSCEDVDECKEHKVCRCPECKCKDTWGGFECTCSGGLLYMQENDACISKRSVTKSNLGGLFWIVVFGLAAAGVGVYVVYKYRIRSDMDSEIRSIMAQYMPLDGQVEVPTRASHVDM